MVFEKKSPCSFNYLFLPFRGGFRIYLPGLPGSFRDSVFLKKLLKCTQIHQCISPECTSAFVDSVRSCPPKVENTSSEIAGFRKSRRHSATVCEGICSYPKWIHSKHTNTFRGGFRIHLPGLPGPFRDSVFWTMANTAGMHSGRMIQII